MVMKKRDYNWKAQYMWFLRKHGHHFTVFLPPLYKTILWLFCEYSSSYHTAILAPSGTLSRLYIAIRSNNRLTKTAWLWAKCGLNQKLTHPTFST